MPYPKLSESGSLIATALAALTATELGVLQSDLQLGPIFASRSEATTASSGKTGASNIITVIQDGFARNFIYDAAGTALTTGDARTWSPAGDASLAHFGENLSTDATAAIAAAITWINAAAALRVLYLPPGTIRHSGPWPAITGQYKRIIGNGTQLLNTNSGKFFIFGTDTTEALRCGVYGVHVGITGTADPNDFAFDFYRAPECTAHVTSGSVACFARFGSASYSAAGSQFIADTRMIFNHGANADSNFLILRGQNLYIECIANCSVQANTNTTGAMIRMAPPTGEQVDTVLMKVQLQTEIPTDTLLVQGKPYGLYVDNTLGFATNVWMDPVSCLDHTTVASVYVTDDVATVRTLLGNYRFNNVRLTPDVGRGVWLDKKSNVNQMWTNFSIQDSTTIMRTAHSAIEITGTGYAACVVSGNQIGESSPETAKPAAIKIGSNRWTINDNIIGLQTSGTTSGISAGVEVTSDALTDLHIAGNHIGPGIASSLTLPTFVTADISAPRRNISYPGFVSARALTHILHPVGDAAVTANVLTILASGFFTCGFTVNQTVNRIVSGFPVGTQIIVINNGTPTVSFSNATNRFRLLSTSPVTLSQFKSATFILSAYVGAEELWQQVAGIALPVAVADVTGAAPLASPTFTGIPAVPTAAPGTNTTQAASTAFVVAADALNAKLAGANTFTGSPTFAATDVAVTLNDTDAALDATAAARIRFQKNGTSVGHIGFSSTTKLEVSVDPNAVEVNSTFPIKIDGTTVAEFEPVATAVTANSVITGTKGDARYARVGLQTGWTADTGTDKRTANATYSGAAEAVYTQATIQTLMDALRDATRTIKSLKDDLTARGIIGA